MLLARARPTNPEALVRDLGSRDFRVRIEAAEHAPTVVGDDTADLRARIIGALVAALRDDHEAVRSAVALALADLQATEALPALLLAADDDAVVVRQQAIIALGELGDPRASERIRRALRDPRPEVRFQAIVAYPRIACVSASGNEIDHEVWAALSVGLEDEDALVRSRAAEACAELADGADLPAMVGDRLARIARDTDELPDPRIAAAITLGESGDRRCTPVLLAVLRGQLEEKDPRRVQAIFELAGELGVEEVRPLALEAAFSFRSRFGDPSRRAAALIALIRLGDRRAIDHVLAELGARGWERRVVATGIVARTRLTEARSRLESMKQDPMLGDIATDALARLDA